MVARITYGKNIVGMLEYNKLKVDKETAGVLCCHKLPVMPLDGKIDFHKLVEAFAPHLSDPRSRLSDPVFHASLNPHPEDRLSDARLIEIAHEYMERMGYGAQPFVVFKHEDIARSHLHIVSVSGRTGKRSTATTTVNALKKLHGNSNDNTDCTLRRENDRYSRSCGGSIIGLAMYGHRWPLSCVV